VQDAAGDESFRKLSLSCLIGNFLVLFFSKACASSKYTSHGDNDIDFPVNFPYLS
jgi:hypothetical protein